jgi:hypothetical protein
MDLMPLTRKRHISPFLTFDIEATDWSQFGICGVYDGVDYERFDGLGPAFNRLVCKDTRECLLFAHNLSYDGMFILDHILNERPDLKAVPTLNGSRLIAISVSDGNKHHWKFRDSFSILPSSLKKLTDSFNVEHKKLDEHDEKGMISNADYNRNDCIGLYEVLLRFFAMLDGKVGMTISQTSLLNFRERFQKSAIRSVYVYEDCIREAYYGGRTEIFSYNLDPEKEFYLYDINSLYPYCLAHYDFPFGKFKPVHPDIDAFGFSHGVIDDDLYFPLIPERIDQKMLFRRGIKTGWYSNQEFRRAEALGCRVEVDATLATEEYGKIFEEFVLYWYDKRAEAKASGNDALQLVCKLIMNSLYGKFAQERMRSKTLIHPERVHDGMEAVKFGRHIIYKVKDKSKASHIIPSISAMTTAYARIVMHRNFMKAGKDHLFYTDTDSCILDSKAFEHSKELGEMKLEETIHGLNIVLPKVYFYLDDEDKTHIKLKGVPFPARADSMTQRRILLEFLERRKVENKAGLFSFGRAVIHAKSRNLSSVLFNKEISRTLKTYYDKRKIEPDFSCSPFRINEDRTANQAPFETILQYAKNSLSVISE